VIPGAGRALGNPNAEPPPAIAAHIAHGGKITVREFISEFRGMSGTAKQKEVLTEVGDRTYPSLSAVARAITGTSWNGRRFFGLQMKRKADPAEAGR
jgi:Protein of unknown function (DUF2924)